MRDEIKVHYQIGLLGLLPLILVMTLGGCGPVAFSHLCVGYTWSLLLNSPGIMDRAVDPRYKLSFFRLVVSFDRNVRDAFSTFGVDKAGFYARMLGPGLFALASAAIMNRPLVIFITLIGFSLSEIIVHCGRDYLRWKDIFSSEMPEDPAGTSEHVTQ